MYKLIPATNKKQRNDFIIDNFDFYTFWSSWEAGDFHQLEGHSVCRYTIQQYSDKGEMIVGVLQFFIVKAKRGIFLLSQHGPMIKGDYFAVVQSIVPALQSLAKQYGASFWRVSGLTQNTLANLQAYKKTGFHFAPLHVSAEEMYLLDVTRTEDELKAGMRKTTRYMINRATKEGVTIKQDNSLKRIKAFVHLHHKHANRTNGKRQYHAYSESYIINLFKAFGPENINLFDAWYKDECEATCITIQFGKHAAYYLGASDIKHPKFSPAYLAQRAGIIHAKQSGCTTYNFRGVAPDDNKNHPLYGVSLFKRGFGGRDYFLTHAHDYSFSSKYRVTYAIESVRRHKRGYYYPKPTI